MNLSQVRSGEDSKHLFFVGHQTIKERVAAPVLVVEKDRFGCKLKLILPPIHNNCRWYWSGV